MVTCLISQSPASISRVSVISFIASVNSGRSDPGTRAWGMMSQFSRTASISRRCETSRVATHCSSHTRTPRTLIGTRSGRPRRIAVSTRSLEVIARENFQSRARIPPHPPPRGPPPRPALPAGKNGQGRVQKPRQRSIRGHILAILTPAEWPEPRLEWPEDVRPVNCLWYHLDISPFRLLDDQSWCHPGPQEYVAER